MLKYYTVAIGLKAFSSCSAGHKLYRRLGNVLGGQQRANAPMPSYYVERVQRMLRLSQNYGVVGDGSRVLELGTGWVHWEAFCLRLFFDVDAVLFDVWDNRQLGALKHFASQLKPNISSFQNIGRERMARAERMIEEVSAINSFDELYAKFNFKYELEPSGTLAKLPGAKFDTVISAGVFEHLPRAIVPDYIKDTCRILRPGGFAVHSINTTDHLYLYDRTASPKQYLKYPDRTWRLLFENSLQYVNRLQRCEWMAIFESAGFKLVEEASSTCSLNGLQPSSRYQNMDRQSLETTTWDVVYQKPG
jgi:SAM-dependent methyltransferase